jgi:N-acetylglucosaminyl-diphospho-decaprenol L-rhamnosyltransferase
MTSIRKKDLADVCAIVASHNGREWLDAALSSLMASAGECSVEVVVVDNGSDGAGEWAAARFPGVRSIHCENRGFGHANNRGLELTRSRYVLFLNPDTEVLSGTLAELVAVLDAKPDIGLAGTRQLRTDGELAPSIRRFPSPARGWAEALGVEQVPLARRALGERELDAAAYDRCTPCDWTSGSFMLARRSALEAVGHFDESFFLFSEETDLCWRLKRDGWRIVHLPQMTIKHHEQPHWANAQMEAQLAYARLQFARKHLPGSRLYRCSLALRYALRVGAYSVPGRRSPRRREAARAALGAVLAARPPFRPA